MIHPNDLVLGVDGGGSKTVAWLANCDTNNQAHVIGIGRSGPSNHRSIGVAQASENLDRAIDSAFDDAKLTRIPVAGACVSLAGADRILEQQQFHSWAALRHLANRLAITNDAIPVLYAASNDGTGIALISGTGSFAFGRTANGETARCGGWGGLFGDEGSGYHIALAGLRAASRAADGRGPQTVLLANILDHFGITEPSELIPIIYAAKVDRSTIARIAPVVFDSDDAGDEVAGSIVDQAVADLNELVVTLAERLVMTDTRFSLAVTGGVLLHQPRLIDKLRDQMATSGLEKVTIMPVNDPVAGAIVIAREQRSEAIL